MYRKILVALENGPADESLIPHVAALARQCGAELLLLHVADGCVARNYDQLQLSESQEMKEDRAYLEAVADRLRAMGLGVTARLALGNPPTEIVKVADGEHCDLIAMTTHGHRFLSDFFLGSTITKVRHQTYIPVLLVRAAAK